MLALDMPKQTLQLMKPLSFKKIVFALTFTSLVFLGAANADEGLSPLPKVTDEWRFSASVYGWLPNVNTTVNNGGPGSKNADISMNNVLSNLKSGAMMAGEAHYGKWGILVDFANATLQKSGGFNFKGDPQYRAGDKSTLQASLFDLAGTYNVLSNQDAYIDALAGVRWIGITTTFDLMKQGGPVLISASSSTSATYGIVGVNGRYRIMDSTWYVPFYADAGTGGGANHTTWQASLGVGKTVSKNIDVSLVYRAIGFDIKSGNNDSALLKGLFFGPQIMATINF